MMTQEIDEVFQFHLREFSNSLSLLNKQEITLDDILMTMNDKRSSLTMAKSGTWAKIAAIK